MDNFITDIDDISYVYVIADPSRGPGGFEYCQDADCEDEARASTRAELEETWAERIKDHLYQGQEVFILKETRQFVTRI